MCCHRSNDLLPLESGYTLVDSLMPVYRGQTILSVGDFGSGKSTFSLDTIIYQNQLNQRKRNGIKGMRTKLEWSGHVFTISYSKEKMHCIYVIIGMSSLSVERSIKILEAYDAMKYTTVVLASQNDPPLMISLSVLAGAQLGQYWREEGFPALVIYDGLEVHQLAFLSLMGSTLKTRAIVHHWYARLMEKSCAIQNSSMTSWIIINVKEEQLESDIGLRRLLCLLEQLIDRKLSFQIDLANKGVWPALDWDCDHEIDHSIGLNSSRIQSPFVFPILSPHISLLSKVLNVQTRKLMNRVVYTLELSRILCEIAPDEALNEEMQANIDFGLKLKAILCQKEHAPYSSDEQCLLLYSAIVGFLNPISSHLFVDAFKQQLIEAYRSGGGGGGGSSSGSGSVFPEDTNDNKQNLRESSHSTFKEIIRSFQILEHNEDSEQFESKGEILQWDEMVILLCSFWLY